MGERLRTTAAQHPGRALGVLAAVAVLGAALAAGWTDRLALSTSDSKGAALQIQLRGGLPAQSATYRVAVRTMRIQLSGDPAVAAVRERRNSGAGSTLLLVRFDVGGRRRDAAIERIERNLDPGPLTIAFSGPAAAVRIAKDDALDDLVLLLLALPVVALIAAGTFGVRPAGAALLAAGAASALATIGCELLADAIDVFWLALVGATAAGTLVALQLCAMARAGAAPAALWGSGIAAAATFAATAALGVDYLASLGLGGGLGSLLAIPASVAAMGAANGLDPPSGAGRASAPWRGISELIGWSRLMGAAIAVLALCLLLIAAAPIDRLVTVAIGAAAAPSISDAELAAAIGGAALITVILGWAVSRRFALALSTTLAAAIPALAVAGLLVVSFQEGGLEDSLDYTSNGAVQLGSLVAAVAVVAALCAAQAVALAWAARQTEGRREGVDRVVEAMAHCGPAAAVTCLAGTVAGIALGFGSPRFLKEFGLGVAAGLILELLIVQALLAPAALRLTYRRARDQ